MTDVSPFQTTGELPRGAVLLEASAGTGKTYQIAALACRYIAEANLSIDQLLMVTFGTAATRELRTRVFDQLVRVVDALATTVDSGQLPDDPLVAHLASVDAHLRLARLREAVSAFDAATIATTHTFCATMLDRLGIIADWDAGARFTDTLTELAGEVADDLFVARYASATRPPFDLTYARKIAREAVEHTDELFEADEHVDEVSFAHAVRHEVAARKARAQLYTYDDLIARMRDTMTHPLSGPLARRRLSARYPVVLVDEFQDTDPQQWEVLRQAFVGASTVVLIGDPKQSIYGFRNADLHCYFEAMAVADAHHTLPVNHRSDPGVVTAVGEVFADLELGDPRVVVRPVTPHRQVDQLRRRDGRPSAPLRVRMLGGNELTKPQSEDAIARDLVVQVIELLRDYELAGRPVRPRDIAILVRQRSRVEKLQHLLHAAGVPAVFPGGASVFATSAASSWLDVLTAWLHPTPRTVRTAAIGDLIGLEIADLATDDARALAHVAERLKQAGRLATQSGIAAGWHAMRDLFDIEGHLLGRAGGEATLVDLAHLAEVLNATQWRQRLGLDGVAAWLDRQVSAERLRDDDQDTSRRLASGEDAVQLLTMHGAKGLQFPVVLLPTISSWAAFGDKDPFVFAAEGRRRLFVGVRARRSAAWQRHLDDAQAEELRLTYVAMTRAESGVIAWWAPTRETSRSPLHRLLARSGRPRPLPDYRLDTTAWPTSFPAVSFEAVAAEPVSAPPAQLPAPTARALRARQFTRQIDTTWRRTSYSGLTSAAHDAAWHLGDEGDPRNDETGSIDVPLVEADSTASAPLPLGELPGGTSFGSLVHEVLEYLDWSRPDLAATVDEALDQRLDRSPLPGVDRVVLRHGLVAALTTPLGALTGGRHLAQLPPAERLAELAFDLPLGRVGVRTVADLAKTIADNLPADDPLAAYPEALLASPAASETLHGFLTGSIDAVLHVDGRYLVVDYKTNRLQGEPGTPLTVGHYGGQAMAQAMIASHYPLQALLYSVALHRFLAWRLPGYSPQKHLGGVGYLFVRGMIGPGTPVIDGMPCGVFGWHPSPELIVAASAVLEGRHG